jgi:VIT1/CCC1 family predicted Fe2+/Mn2+ transporter
MTTALDSTTLKALLALQRGEATDALVYARMARAEKHERHRQVLERIAADECEHYQVWKRHTGADVAAQKLKVAWYSLLTVLLGYTFVLRLMESGENRTAAAYLRYEDSIPEIQAVIAHEQEHEELLIQILDEERLHYVGAMVLGLNDALVELTGTIAGLTFALANTRVVALAGIITGIAATLSMASSSYLAERAEGKPHPLKSALYTGIAYLITVAALIAPYLVFGEQQYIQAFIVMIISCIVIILAFNFYISIAQRKPFWSHFGHMAAVSLGVATIAFLIGMVAKQLLGVDVG